MYKNKKKHFFKFIFLIFIIIFSFLLILPKQTYFKTKPEEFALGKNIQVDDGFLNGKQVLCTSSIQEINKCINNLKLIKNKKNILWFGNSQLYSINQKKKNEISSSVYTAANLKNLNLNLVSIGLPNGSLKEFLIVFYYISSKVKIDTLILPVFFDDTREDKIRFEIQSAFADLSVLNKLKKSIIGKKIIKDTNLNFNQQNINNLQNIPKLKDLSEKKIKIILNDYLNWDNQIKGYQNQIWYLLYQVRNYIFNLKSSSKRKIIKSYYNDNLLSFEEILNYSNKKNINLIIYIPPVRDDFEPPYHLNEYIDFKDQIERISLKYNFKVRSFEKLIPNTYWGTVNFPTLFKKDNEEIDFMHFQYFGHKIIGEKIIQILKEIY